MLRFNFKKAEHDEAVFQILILIIASFAFVYIIHQADLIPVVSAKKEDLSCCLNAKNGAVCQNVKSEDCSDYCDLPCVPTKCEDISECRSGCCFDPVEGLCTTKAPKQKCEQDGGEWNENEMCLIEKCQRGCCVLGSETQYVTEKRCQMLSSLMGFEKDFRDIQQEIECLILEDSQEMGACILEGGSCGVQTEVECLTIRGDFHKNYLCSHPDLDTDCQKQAEIGCVEGRDEIYWYDSCGNIENIYSSDEDASWNGGKLLTKEQSCNSGSANINSENCGNCNYLLGSKCSTSNLLGKDVKDGNFICKDMSCVDENGDKRANGESWCVYEGQVGEGRDVVGSRHYRYLCIDGEVKSEPCQDYRQQICIEAERNQAGKDISMAACRTNMWRYCLNSNSEEGPGDCPTEDCHITEVDVDDAFNFEVCTPSYPSGWDLSGEGDPGACEMATQTCIVFYVKTGFGGWKCEVNCECEEDTFANEMNKFCSSLGDCGAFVNVAGRTTEGGYDVENTEELSDFSFTGYAKPAEGQKAIPGDINEILKLLGLPTGAEDPSNSLGQSSSSELGAYLNYNIGDGTIDVGKPKKPKKGISWGLAAAGAIGGGVVVGAIAYKIAAWKAANAAANLAFGNAAASVAGGAGGGATTAAGGGMSAGAIGALAGIIAAIIIFVILSFLVKKVKKVEVKFFCYPWEVPAGAEDCHVCNEDELRPCTEYKCNSLGQACEFSILDSGDPYCYGLDNDGTAPVISPWKEYISKDYKYTQISNNGFEIKTKDGKCIPAFEPIYFGILTNEKAQCKIGGIEKTEYDAIGKFFGGTNKYTINHSMESYLPSAISIAEILTQLTEETDNEELYSDILEEVSDINLYVRCQDVHGNRNMEDYEIKMCVEPGPDLESPRIVEASPENNDKIPYLATEQQVLILINEPAECKWSLEDKSYNDMENQMTCYTDFASYIRPGWPCEFIMPVDKVENQIYIRCKDQPWLLDTTNGKNKRNVNVESYSYVLYSSESGLNIDAVFPEGEILEGFEPISVELEAETSGGADNGVSKCYYSFTDYNLDYMIEFFETNSNRHEQTFNTISVGDYNIYLICEDEAENIAYGNATFSLNIDTAPPVAVRVYNQGGQLMLITDEDAECYYNFKRCNFNINANESISMTTAFSKEHSADWNPGIIYYIKCKDIWGNAASGCTIKVMPNALI